MTWFTWAGRLGYLYERIYKASDRVGWMNGFGCLLGYVDSCGLNKY